MVTNEGLIKISRGIRADALRETTEAGSGHPGGSLSATDILVTLYWEVLRHDPRNPGWPDRDRFILSKGHAAPALYAVLAKRGYFPREELHHLREYESMLQGHPDATRTPGVEVSSGSLGNGLSIASGVASALKLDGRSSRVYCLLGDGECDEGLVWEAAMFVAHRKLDNLTAIIDRNGLQIDGPTEKVLSLEPLADKWRSFNWNVICVNGHDYAKLLAAFDEAKITTGKPTVIIADTVKGKGVSFMEGVVSFHGKACTSTELETACKELEG
ncbi:MAG: transketolase [Candidatus Bathyarchaeia archaeon]|jgi:transketolase